MKALAVLFLAACASSPTPAQQAAVALDLAEQKECVEKGTTRAEVDACRAAVKARRAK